MTAQAKYLFDQDFAAGASAAEKPVAPSEHVILLAEAESHHPEIELEWGRAAFRTWTFTASGLSRNDFIMAAKIDLLAGD